MQSSAVSNRCPAPGGRWELVYRSRLHYLVTWATRGRKSVLRERHLELLRRWIPQLCEERGITCIEVAAGSDHVHLLFGLPPAQSVASAVREIKGRAATVLMEKYPELRVWLGGHLLWDERYAVETVSAIRLPRIQERLRLRHRTATPLAQAS